MNENTEQLPQLPIAKAVSEIQEAQRLRGWIANSYAQIEFLLGDLILRCAEFHEYNKLTQTLPHGAPDRVKRVKSILTTDGPMTLFSSILLPILSRFESGHETRNLLAHGFCEYLYTPAGDTGLQFQKWHRQPDRQDARLIRTFRLNQLQTEMEGFVELADEAMTQFLRIHKHFSWVARSDE